MNGRDRLTLSMRLMTVAASSPLKSKTIALLPHCRSTGRGRVAGVDGTGGGVRYTAGEVFGKTRAVPRTLASRPQDGLTHRLEQTSVLPTPEGAHIRAGSSRKGKGLQRVARR